MKTFNPNNLESHWQFHAKFHGKLYSGPVFQEPLKMRPGLHKFGRIWVRSQKFLFHQDESRLSSPAFCAHREMSERHIATEGCIFGNAIWPAPHEGRHRCQQHLLLNQTSAAAKTEGGGVVPDCKKQDRIHEPECRHGSYAKTTRQLL